MIKQDYLIRMIQEIISLLVNVIINKKRLREQEWSDFDNLSARILGFSTEKLLHMDADELIEQYKGDPDFFGKLELAAMYQIKLAEELTDSSLFYRSKLQHNALQLLTYIQKESKTFSLSRIQVIQHLEQKIN